MTATYISFKESFNLMMIGLVDTVPGNLDTKWNVINVFYNPSSVKPESILEACKNNVMVVFEALINFYNNYHDVAFFILCVRRGLITIENMENHLKPKVIFKGSFDLCQLTGAVCLSIWCTDQIPRKERPVMAFISAQCPNLMDYFSKAEPSCFIESEMHFDWAKRLDVDLLPLAWNSRAKLGLSGYRLINALNFMYINFMNEDEKEKTKPIRKLFEGMSFAFHNRFGMTASAKQLFSRIKNSLSYAIAKYNVEGKMLKAKHISKPMKEPQILETFTDAEITEFLKDHEYMFLCRLPVGHEFEEKQAIFRLWKSVPSTEFCDKSDKPDNEESDDEDEIRRKKDEEEEIKKKIEQEKDKDNNTEDSKNKFPKGSNNKMKLRGVNEQNENKSSHTPTLNTGITLGNSKYKQNSSESKRRKRMSYDLKIKAKRLNIRNFDRNFDETEFSMLKILTKSLNSKSRKKLPKINNKENFIFREAMLDPQHKKINYHERDKVFSRAQTKVRKMNRDNWIAHKLTGSPYVPIPIPQMMEEETEISY